MGSMKVEGGGGGAWDWGVNKGIIQGGREIFLSKINPNFP